jgi:hypothetical protein
MLILTLRLIPEEVPALRLRSTEPDIVKAVIHCETIKQAFLGVKR